jgi:hypothetical protein
MSKITRIALSATMLDINIGVSERIKAALAGQMPHYHDRLAGAADTVGAQLAWMTPAVMAPSAKGVAAGPAAAIKQGTVIVLLASPKAIVTLYLQAAKKRRQELTAAAALMRGKLMACSDRPSTTDIIKFIVHDHGVPPGKDVGRP